MCWAWVSPLENDACDDEHFHAPVLGGAQHVLHVLVPHVPKGKRGRAACVSFTCHLRENVGGGTRVLGVGSAAGRWR